jgi:large subunit ribosomal protein L20
MPRAVDGTRRKDHRKKIMKRAKGFWGRSQTNYKVAKDAITMAMNYAYTGRKDRKGDFRTLWIARINAACRPEGITYSRLIQGMSKAGIGINRKALSNMAIEDPTAFQAVVSQAKVALGA